MPQASRCSTRSPEPAFIVGLLQSGLINVDDLQRTFSDELHANELVLLAC